MKLCYMDGSFFPFEDAKLPLTDYMVLRGIGVFDIVRTYGGRPMMLTYHLERLLKSAAALGIESHLGLEDMKGIVAEGLTKLDSNGDSLVRFYITGGDVFEDECRFPEPRYFASFEELKLPPDVYYKKGVRLFPIDRGRLMPSAKSIDYSATLAKNSVDPEALEVLYCPDGEITEAGHSSFFMVKDGVVVTAPDERVLSGTTRSLILNLLRENKIPVVFRCPRLEEIEEVDEAFITGSVKEIMPVNAVGRRKLRGKCPGEFTLKICRIYSENVYRWLE